MVSDTCLPVAPLPSSADVVPSGEPANPENPIGLVGGLMAILDVRSLVISENGRASRVDRLTAGQRRVTALGADPLAERSSFEAGLWTAGWDTLPESEVVSRVQSCRRVFQVAVAVTVVLQGERDRTWWETRFIAGGFRRHPLGQLLVPFEELEHESGPTTLLFSRIPDAALAAHPPEQLARERDLHMDMLREPGIRSDAHLARYILARTQVRPGMVVLDVACGLGYGSAILASGTGARRVHGVDLSDWAVRYARVHYSSARLPLDFQAGDATRLTAFPDASVDLVVSFETLEHMPNPGQLLAEFARVLRPGGRFVGSVPNLWIDGEGRNPVPFHFHIYDHTQFHEQLGRWFEWKELHRQNAGGGWKRPQGRLLRRVPGGVPSEEDRRDAEWWIGVAEKPALPAPGPVSSPVLASARVANEASVSQVATPGPLDPSTRILVLDEEARHHDLFGSIFERLGVRPECGHGRDLQALLESRPSLILLSREWTPDWRLAAAGARRLGIPVVYVMDGVIEWSYVWNNLSHIRGQGTFLQPLIATDLCVIGRHPARILATLGLGPRMHVIGLPRLDGYDRRRVVEVGARPRVVVATARTAGHDTEQQLMTLRALRDLRDWFAANDCAEVIWRIAADLAEELGLAANLKGSLSEVLGGAAALITFPSTCALEGMLKGIPVAQVEYRSVPLYVATGWEIRSADHIPGVVQELLHPPAARLAHQDACLADELESGNAGERLEQVIRSVLARPCLPEIAAGPAPAAPGGRLDYRLVHPELSVFAAAPSAMLQYELDAAHGALRRVKAERMEERRQLRELAEAVTGADLEDLGQWPFLEHFSSARLQARPPGSASLGVATLAGRTGRTIFLHPPARLLFVVPVTASGRFTFSVGMHPDVWDNRESGACRFQVVADGRLVADLTLDPVHRQADRRWVRAEAILPAVPALDGVHRIELVTSGVGGEAFRWALWRSPVFTWVREVSESLSEAQGAVPVPATPEHYEPGRTLP